MKYNNEMYQEIVETAAQLVLKHDYTRTKFNEMVTEYYKHFVNPDRVAFVQFYRDINARLFALEYLD